MRLTRLILRSKSAAGVCVPDAHGALLARCGALRDSGVSQLSDPGSNPGGEGWAPPGYLDQACKDASDLLGLLDNSDDVHFESALGAGRPLRGLLAHAAGADKRIDRCACAS